MKAPVQFVAITTDPKRDAGQALRDYGEAHRFDPVNWIFLTAAPDDPEDGARMIARAYGLKFTRRDEGTQTHGVVTQLIEQDGRLRARLHGLQFGRANLATYVNALTDKTQEQHRDRGPVTQGEVAILITPENADEGDA